MTRDLRIAALVLAIPIIPFLILGGYLEPQIEAYLKGEWLLQNRWAAVVIILAALCLDILLPVPSSAVCTLAGAVFGTFGGFIVNWLGLSLGSLIGYEVARQLSARPQEPPTAPTLVGQALPRTQRYGIWVLALSRGIPLLAEASVIAAGIWKVPRRQAWSVIGLANAVIAGIYAWMGHRAAESEMLILVLAVSLMIPLIGLLLLAGRFSRYPSSRYD